MKFCRGWNLKIQKKKINLWRIMDNYAMSLLEKYGLDRIPDFTKLIDTSVSSFSFIPKTNTWDETHMLEEMAIRGPKRKNGVTCLSPMGDCLPFWIKNEKSGNLLARIRKIVYLCTQDYLDLKSSFLGTYIPCL